MNGPWRWSVPVAAAVLFQAAAAVSGDPQVPSLTVGAWQTLGQGIEVGEGQADRYCVGSRTVSVVRMDPSRCRIAPFHEAEEPDRPRRTTGEWLETLEASVAFNAGLYDESRQHLGLLQRDDVPLAGIRHRSWHGYFVADLRDGETGAPATILEGDREEDLARVETYRTVVQSMMLLDREGKTRVRRTERTARRVLLAEDVEGRILVLVTHGSATLWEAARLLAESELDIVAAMALDGGSEAQLAVRTPNASEVHAGTPRSWDGAVHPPAVVAVWPGEIR